MSDYDTRSATMESWYQRLLTLDEREELLLHDYAPHEQFLASLAGDILDVGGGAGLAARFLRADARYVVVDPSEIWRSPEWMSFSRHFRRSGPEPTFVAAAGEDLPFADGRFDAVLSFWSLNHVRDPALCVAEIIRALKPGGAVRIVAEDVEPSWRDLLLDGAARLTSRLMRRRSRAAIQKPLLKAFAMKVGGRWEIQEDHIRISESELLSWTGEDLELCGREWLDGALTYDFRKRSS